MKTTPEDTAGLPCRLPACMPARMPVHMPVRMSLWLLLWLVFSMAVPVCAAMAEDNGYRTITSAEAKAILESGAGYVLLDVRTPEEFAGGHIRGALLLPYTEIRERAAQELPDKDMSIVLYCRSGRRSAIAAAELVRMGYVNVYDAGSIYDWPQEDIVQ